MSFGRCGCILHIISIHGSCELAFTADGPVYKKISQSFGINGTNLTVVLDLMANPPVGTDFIWKMNGKNISNTSSVTLTPGSVSFTPLLVENDGNYSVRSCNNISCATMNFTFDVYCELWVWSQLEVGVVMRKGCSREEWYLHGRGMSLRRLGR